MSTTWYEKMLKKLYISTVITVECLVSNSCLFSPCSYSKRQNTFSASPPTSSNQERELQSCLLVNVLRAHSSCWLPGLRSCGERREGIANCKMDRNTLSSFTESEKRFVDPSLYPDPHHNLRRLYPRPRPLFQPNLVFFVLFFF